MQPNIERVFQDLRTLRERLIDFHRSKEFNADVWRDLMRRSSSMAQRLGIVYSVEWDTILPRIRNFAASQTVNTLRALQQLLHRLREEDWQTVPQELIERTYVLKNALLELVLFLPQSRFFSCEVGIASDESVLLSILIHMPQWMNPRFRYHLPIEAVTPRAQGRIRTRCGQFPPKRIIE